MFKPTNELVRLAITQNGQILLCRIKGQAWYFLPGGSIETGETATYAIARELREELGFTQAITPNFMGSITNSFIQEGVLNQGLEHYYHLPDLPLENINSQEKHIEFSYHNIQSLSHLDIRPYAAVEGINTWLSNSSMFFMDHTYPLGR